MLDYENGRQDPLDTSDVEIALNSSNLEVGRNEITITYHYTYKDEGGSDTTKDFSTSVYIYVYSVDEITISDFSMEYTGGIYYTNNVQKVFLVGDGINYDYAAVTAYATCSYKDEEGENYTLTKEFVMTSEDGLTFSNDANFSVAGTYQVTATANMGQTEGNPKTASYDIHVVEVTSSTDITSVEVIAPTEGEEENATYETGEDGIISVATINDAIKLIKLMGATDKERKFIYVGAGVYNEKVYIDIPNLSLIGFNPSETQNLATKSEVTEIVYDAMNGVMDPSGTTTYSTVGSATVTVASQATDFYAANITFRNYWNTNALYNEAKTMTSDTQADAAYINADRAHFYNVTFTGYHDTLEAENGRQYYDHCYIEGRTDYIFGNTATCYFKDCTIHTIGAGSSTNGGYVTAVKGGSMTYGYVFDGCNFTSDLKTYYIEGDGELEVPYDGFAYTEEGTVSLGRTWSSSDMHVAVINSTLDAGYSTTAYGSSGKNPRYTDMSGYAPNENYLVEYNNTGEGAISASLSGTCSLLTEEAAASYTIENIFARENGEMIYDSDWDPSSVALITITVKGTSGADVAKIYAKDSISVSDLVDAINARLSDTQVAAIYKNSALTEEITEDIVASEGNSVTVYIKTEEKDMSVTKSTYWDFYNENFGTEITTSGYLDDEEKLYLDVSEGGSFERYNGKYYYMNGATITLTLNAGAILCIGVYQEDSVSMTDEAGNILTLETLSAGNDKTAYTYTAAKKMALTIAPGAQALYFMYMNVSVGPINDDTTITFRDKTQNTMEYSGCCGWYYDICIDATAGKFQVRSSGDAIVNAGTILYIRSTENATAKINWYTGYEGKEEGNITVDGNGYIKIIIELPENPTNGGSRYIWDIVVTVQT
ncbi:MAG: pectinesterase family protein [Clostridia bacterium]|nr:pectinesterase family protein [Clostridia bacterium]